jgi:lipid-binding SYLF domain-containing protein
MFFMNPKALAALDAAKGFEIGVGPTVVALDAGAAANLTTTTGRADVYSFVLDQKGLMAGVNVQGSKITRINPKP